MRVRFDYDGEYAGWYLARKSNTEAILVMRVEAKTEQALAQMMQIIDQRVSPILDISKLLNA